VDPYDILKHRNDAFRLATTLPGTRGPGLVESIREDMVIFLGYFLIQPNGMEFSRHLRAEG
jgi:hypothetical protein